MHRLWTAPANTAAGIEGTANLVDTFEWFEQTLGPYPFGGSAGSVGVNWGPGAYGGMEHHPCGTSGSPRWGTR